MPLLTLLAAVLILGLAWARLGGSLFGPAAPPGSSATPGNPAAAPAQPPAATLRQAERAVDAASQAEQRRLDDAMQGLTPGSGP
ncbi:MAG: hypothetical protein VKJ05_08870 [Synechococcaceae cyanobacterium]|nr:hypothetical protein [Synechococcaceae cyanobacterium]